MRPDERDARRGDSQPPRNQRQGTNRSRRGPGGGAPGGVEGVRLRPARARGDAARLVQPLVRRGRSARAGHQGRHPLADARQRAGRHRRDHARARHRRQRRDLQRRPRRAAAPARQSRRGSPDLHPSKRAGPRHREHDVLGGGVQRHQSARHQDGRRVRRILDDRFHAARRTGATRDPRRRRRRLVLRCDGPAAGAGTAAECRRTMARVRRARWC